MFDLQHLKKIKRINADDSRNFKLGLRADRNEKIEDWPREIFKKFSKILKLMNSHRITIHLKLRKLNLERQNFLS